MAILASEEKIRTILDRAYFLGAAVEQARSFGQVSSRTDQQYHFDKFVAELKTA